MTCCPHYALLQGVSQILSASASTVFMTSFAGVFNISTETAAEAVSTEDDGWCFIDGLKQREKIFIDLIAPAMITTLCVILFIFSKCIFRKRIRFGSKKVNFQAAGLAVFLFIVGKIVDTQFKLISCRFVGTTAVHWYFAYTECYGATWIISVCTLLAIIVLFGFVFLLTRRLTPEQRADKNRFAFQLCRRFKPQFWYWEYVIFVRRIIIAFCAVGTTEILTKLIFLGAMVVFICIQWRTEPFASKQANQVCR